ncbi:MAG: hypothetical protein ACETWM_21505 [Candidatus Lokiarchaeia archaeon]
MFGWDKWGTRRVLRIITVIMVFLTLTMIASFVHIMINRPDGMILPGMDLRWSTFGVWVNGVKILEMNINILWGSLLFFGIPLALLFLIGVPFIFIRSLHMSGEYEMFRDVKDRLNFIIKHGSRKEKSVVVFVTLSFMAAYVYLLLLALNLLGVIN